MPTQVSAGFALTSTIVGRAAPYVLAAALAIGLIATASGTASAKSRKQHAVDLTGFGPVPRIQLPPLHDPVEPVTVAPARFFTINKVLAKLDGHKADGTRVAEQNDANTLSDAPPLAVRAQSSEPFGLFTFEAPEGELWQKWRSVSYAIAKDLEAMARCRALSQTCTPAAKRFIAVIDAARDHSGRARLNSVNRGVNDAIVYMTDMQQHGVPDLWSSPLSTFSTLRGDCEDYAIAKYVALREAGLAPGELRIVLAHDNALGEDHAVLAARQGERWLILDNRRAEIVGDGDVKNLVPLFAIDQGGVKLFAAPYAERLIDRKGGTIAPAEDVSDIGASDVSMLRLLL